jgi:hypothetical protein
MATRNYVVKVNAANEVTITGPDGGSIRRVGSGPVDVEWKLVGADAKQTLKIDFRDLPPAGGTGTPWRSPLVSGATKLTGATQYNEALTALGPGEAPFVTKYTVEVVGSTATPLDPLIIIEK